MEPNLVNVGVLLVIIVGVFIYRWRHPIEIEPVSENHPARERKPGLKEDR